MEVFYESRFKILLNFDFDLIYLFQRSQRIPSSSPMIMIYFLLFLPLSTSLSNPPALPPPTLPRNVKDSLSALRSSVQSSLTSKSSRILVNMPNGCNYKMEDKSNSAPPSNTPTTDLVHRSDRELARIFVEMFQPIGGERISVVMDSHELLSKAEKKWGDVTSICSLVSFDKSPKKKKKKDEKRRNKGFAQIMAEEMDKDMDMDDGSSSNNLLPADTECAIIVAPSESRFSAIKNLSESVGPACLIIIINCRDIAHDRFYTEIDSKAGEVAAGGPYTNAFTLKAVDSKIAPDCLLHKRFSSPWLFSTAPRKLVGPKTISTFLGDENVLSDEQLSSSYEAWKLAGFEDDVLAKVEKGVDEFLSFFQSS